METKVQETARELLSRAAKTLRKRAGKATPGSWDAFISDGMTVVARGLKLTSPSRGSFTCIQLVADLDTGEASDWDHPDGVEIAPKHDARYIALMHPPVALALAALFEQHAGWLAQADDDTPADAADLGEIGHVVEVARTVLRIGGAR